MNRGHLEARLSTALDRVLSGSSSGVEETDELFELLGTAAYLRESLTPVPATEPFRTTLREWLEREPGRRWWEHWGGPLRLRLPAPARRPAIRVAVGVTVGAGAAAAIVIGVIVFRNRRSAPGVAA